MNVSRQWLRWLWSKGQWTPRTKNLVRTSRAWTTWFCAVSSPNSLLVTSRRYNLALNQRGKSTLVHLRLAVVPSTLHRCWNATKNNKKRNQNIERFPMTYVSRIYARVPDAFQKLAIIGDPTNAYTSTLVILYWIINVEEIWKLKPSRKTRERWSSFFQGLWRHHCHDVEMKRCWIYPSKLHKNKKGKHKEYNAVNPTTTLVVDPLNNDDNQAAEPLARSKAIIDSHNTHNSIGAS